ncbi:lipopolysaccharide export system permease protein [Janthinobacterium sp. CG_23.3]|uniref:LPS export ABC transporter permease LptF n=1 Tax=unclassified Janthinobacterium TaxID=2610881 RepID=UPI000477C2B8|nr:MULTISPECIES: LPS export ABC transporter permease LptF [unclassified Janthinobacterium]MEC5163408.1 lipopolysaccharide export system permease protein [Janthinobacterium sp. CG_S6]
MIFHRALQRELTSAAGGIFTVLFSIFVTWTLIKILGEAAGGKVDSSDVIALIIFAALNYLPTILILTSFISVLMVVTRSYRDSEMVVWFASGMSLVRWIRPVLTFGLPLVALTAVLSLYATPWAKHKSNEYVERFQKREDLQKVSPGQFNESASSNRIFFVEGVSGEKANVQNVFVNTLDAKGTTVVVAKEGVISTDAKGERFLVLKNGRRYQGKPGQSDFQTMEFDRYSMRVASKAQEPGGELNVDSMTTMALLKERNQYTMAEVLWRVSAPITTLVLILLAIPLGFVNPRAGSSVNLIIALLVFFTYNNLIKLVEASVKQGRLSFGASWWPLHLVVALVALLLFTWRLNVNHRYHPLVLLGAVKRARRLNKPAST